MVLLLLGSTTVALIEIFIVVAGLLVLVDLVQHSYRLLLILMVALIMIVLLLSCSRCSILKLDLLLLVGLGATRHECGSDCLCGSCCHLVLLSVAVLIILLLLLLMH